MRLSQSSTLALALTLACGTAMGADYGAANAVTYLKGNIEGITQNAGGTLDLTNSKILTLHASDTKFEVPYTAIFGVERKEAVVIPVAKDPLYKVWTLHKRLVMPTTPHEVSFDYKDKTGNLHSMTLEMEASAADRFLVRMRQAETRKAATKGSFWGDGVWKTHRNEAEWNAQHDSEEGAVAAR